MSNYSSQWYQQLLQQTIPPPIYPPMSHYGIPISIPAEQLYNPAYPGVPPGYPNLFPGYPPFDPAYLYHLQHQQNVQGVMKSMLPPYISLQEAQSLDPNLKIKVDPKKLGSFGNSYFDKLKPPKIVEIDSNSVKITPLHKDIPYIIPPKPLMKKAKLVKPLANKTANKFKSNSTSNNKNSQNLARKVQNNNLQSNGVDPYYNAFDLRNTSRSVPNDSPLDLYSSDNNLNTEEQIDMNRNLIQKNRQQIEDYNISINDNQRTKSSSEPYRLEDFSSRSFIHTPLNSNSRTDMHASLKPLSNNLNRTKDQNYEQKSNRSLIDNVDFQNSTEFQIGRTRFKKISPPRSYLSKPPPDEFMKVNNYLDYVSKGRGPNEPTVKKMERLNKKKEFADLIKLRNKNIGKSNSKSADNSEQISLTNSTTNMLISEATYQINSEPNLRQNNVNMKVTDFNQNQENKNLKSKPIIDTNTKENSNDQKKMRSQIENKNSTSILRIENANDSNKSKSQAERKNPNPNSLPIDNSNNQKQMKLQADTKKTNKNAVEKPIEKPNDQKTLKSQDESKNLNQNSLLNENSAETQKKLRSQTENKAPLLANEFSMIDFSKKSRLQKLIESKIPKNTVPMRPSK